MTQSCPLLILLLYNEKYYTEMKIKHANYDIIRYDDVPLLF